MATSSILGGDRVPRQPSGTDVDALGPSDTSDSGSDVQTDYGRAFPTDPASEGAFPIAHGSDTDATGTGERASADPSAVPIEDSDILPDRVGLLPDDAADVNDIDDPTAAEAGELAVSEDDEEPSDDDAAEDDL